MVDKKFTMIPNRHIDGDFILGADKLFLFMILMQSKSSRDICTFSVRQLCTRLNTTTANTNRTKYIINTLKYFQEKQLFIFSDLYDCSNEINIEESLNKNKINLYYAELYIDMNNDFTIIYDDEFNKIIEYCNKNKIDKYLIFRLFLYIARKINNNNADENYKLCFPTIQTIVEDLEISETTVLKYVKILRDKIKVLYYDNVGYKIIKGKYKETNIFYSRMEDKEYVINRINKEKETFNITYVDKKTKNILNQKRSIKQKINILNRKINKTQEDKNKLVKLKNEYEKLIN